MRYDKLVRDKIPGIIQSSGKTPHARILSDASYLAALDEKLNEECAEYQADKSLDELADMLEVIRAIAEARGYDMEELENTRLEKKETRGGFEGKIFLEYVEP